MQITAKMIQKLNPCNPYGEKRLLDLFDGDYALTPTQMATRDCLPQDKLWVFCHLMEDPDKFSKFCIENILYILNPPRHIEQYIKTNSCIDKILDFAKEEFDNGNGVSKKVAAKAIIRHFRKESLSASINAKIVATTVVRAISFYEKENSGKNIEEVYIRELERHAVMAAKECEVQYFDKKYKETGCLL